MEDDKNLNELDYIELEEDVTDVEEIVFDSQETEANTKAYDMSADRTESFSEYVDEEISPEEEEEPSEESFEEPVSTTDVMIAKRQKKRNRKKRAKKIAGPAILIVLVLAAALFMFARSEYFNIGKIQVTGNDYYTDAQIKEIAGAEKGTNIFSIHKRSMVKLLVSDPYILDAEISRDLPDKLVIRIVESEERGAVYSEKNYYVIDSSGVVLRISTDKPKDIPKITGFTVSRGEDSEAIEVKEAKAFNATLSLINTSAKSTISYRRIKVKNGVCYAYVKKKLYIKGLPQDIESCIKSGKLEAVLYDVYEKGIKHGRVSVGSDNYCVFRP